MTSQQVTWVLEVLLFNYYDGSYNNMLSLFE